VVFGASCIQFIDLPSQLFSNIGRKALEKEVAMNQPPGAPEKRRRIYFGLALVLFGCCGCAAHLATVEAKTPRLSATVASEAHLASAIS
jgi:hypothetical protein